MIDTSNEYGGGLSEELIGAALGAAPASAGTTIVSKLDRDPLHGIVRRGQDAPVAG